MRRGRRALTVGFGYEGILGARLEHHVCAPPWLIVDQPPFVALADMVLGQKDIAGYKIEGQQLFFPNASK